MKKGIIFLFILLTNICFLFPQSAEQNKSTEVNNNSILIAPMFTSAVSYSISDNNKNYFSVLLGTGMMFANFNINNEILSRLFLFSILNICYKYSFIEKNNYVMLGYNIFPFMTWDKDWQYSDDPFMYVIGINGAYNINNNIFSIIPEFGISILTLGSLTYRYNIILHEDTRNVHEFMFRISIPITGH